MTHPIRRLLSVALTLAVAVLFTMAPTTNSWSKPKLPVEWFRYVVKFTCGVNNGEPLRVVRGVYATAVSLYNANAGDVTLHKSLALAYPPAEQATGEVSDQIEDVISPGAALQVDCGEIPDEFFFPTPVADHVQGFLVIESSSPLVVEAVYTAAGTLGDVSIDVERIAEQRVIPRPFVRPARAVICHYPPGNPDNRHTLVVDASAVPAHLAHGDTLGVCNGG